MEIPRGFTIGGNAKDYALKLVKNLYGLKQAGRVCTLHLTNKLLKLGFSQGAVNPAMCLLQRFVCFADLL
jgi:hypothetical protein